VREQPDDNGLRVVLADWLEENGHDDRAELIRVQCELTRRGVVARRGGEYPPDLGAEDKALVQREKALLAGGRAEWLTGLPPDHRQVPDTRFMYEFERGLIRLTVTCRSAGGGGVALMGPYLQEVMNRLAALDALAEQPAFAWVAQVELDASGDSFASTVDYGEDYEALFTHPALRHVTSLRLDWMFGTETLDLSPLASRRDLDRLRELSVNASNCDEAAYVDARALWSSPALPNLRRLALVGPYTADDFLPLAESSSFPRLEKLRMSFGHPYLDCDGDRVLEVFADSPRFPQLREVSLFNGAREGIRGGGSGYGPSSVLALLRSSRLPALE
jgi:uncharacterized protein (TIGR02996 family)